MAVQRPACHRDHGTADAALPRPPHRSPASRRAPPRPSAVEDGKPELSPLWTFAQALAAMPGGQHGDLPSVHEHRFAQRRLTDAWSLNATETDITGLRS